MKTQMATKECRRQARELVEALEVRVHRGPPVCETDILSAREFLRQHDFSVASDYFNRLAHIQSRVGSRPAAVRREKRNYGGEAAGCWMQLQSVYDHVIVSTCHAGEFNGRKGRVKISHRFNEAGRVDFVELKFLRSLQPQLDGALRKLITLKPDPGRPQDWHEAEAFALRVLPQELVFLCGNVFRFTREEVLAWLVNIGHWTVDNLLIELRANRVNGCAAVAESYSSQLCLSSVASDEVALPILEHAAALQSTVESSDPESVLLRYARK